MYQSAETNIHRHLVREHWYDEARDRARVTEIDDWDAHWHDRHRLAHKSESEFRAIFGTGKTTSHRHGIATWDEDG